MREKKIRGMKRRTKTLIKRIEDSTKAFPSAFYNGGYWHMALPVSQTFIDSNFSLMPFLSFYSPSILFTIGSIVFCKTTLP